MGVDSDAVIAEVVNGAARARLARAVPPCRPLNRR